MLMQTWAMVIDAYRELCARKLFWVSIGLSLLMVGSFAFVGINAQGLTILWFDLPLDNFNTSVLSRETFYEFVFSAFGISMWLTWAAAVLALITTADLFPSLIRSGSIELHLSKPISRVRLFLTRYCTGLLFVSLQVAVFTLASFFVLGFRGGVWQPRIFLAIPIVVLFFSYLYAVCAFLGILTRSTITALLLTILFWFMVFIVNMVDNGFLDMREATALTMARSESRLERLESNAEQLLIAQRKATGEELPQDWVPTDEELVASLPSIERLRERIVEDRAKAEKWDRLSGYLFMTKTVLPKTGETIALLDRWLYEGNERDALLTAFTGGPPPASDDDDAEINQLDRQKALAEAYEDRSIWWIIGTSLGFEAVMLLLAGWIFVRRDY